MKTTRISWPHALRLTSATCPTPRFHLLDDGHFALETHAAEIGALMRDFPEAVVTFWRQCGTAAMGQDDNAVVDGEVRVRGLRNLRVADSSILPHVTIGDTLAPSVVIGEQAASFILSAGAFAWFVETRHRDLAQLR